MELTAEVKESCRVCRVPNQDGDFECLLNAESSEDKVAYKLSTAGELYEELFGVQIDVCSWAYYPRYLCNSCELQMKLFKELKIKANKTLETLSSKRYLDTIFTDKCEENVTELFSEKEKGLQPYKGDNHNVESNELLNQTINESVELYAENNLYEYEDVEVLESKEEEEDDEDVGKHEELKIIFPSRISNPYEKRKHSEHNIRELTYLKVNVLEATAKTEDIVVEVDHKLNTNIDSNIDFLDVSYLEEATENFDNDQVIIAQNSSNRKLNKTFKCFTCSLEFMDRLDYTTHRKIVHDNKYPCPECPKLFRTSDALRVHSKLHRGEVAYKCDICQKTFNQKVHYQYHMDRHNNIRNYKCEHCSKAFLSKTDLNVHTRIHAGDRRYACEVCGKDFLMMQHLKMHQYSHMNCSFKCEFCKQKFVSPSTLRTHIFTIHENEPRFECEICVKRFRRKHHLNAHYKVHAKPKMDRSKQRQQKAMFEFMEIMEEEQMEEISVVDDEQTQIYPENVHQINNEVEI